MKKDNKRKEEEEYNGDKDLRYFNSFNELTFIYGSLQILSILFIGLSYLLDKKFTYLNNRIRDIFLITGLIYFYFFQDLTFASQKHVIHSENNMIFIYKDYSKNKLLGLVILMIHKLCVFVLLYFSNDIINEYKFLIFGTTVQLIVPVSVEFYVISIYLYQIFINYLNRPILPR